MNISNRKLIIIFACLTVLCLAAMALMQNAPKGNIAEIYCENELVHRIDLSNVENGYKYVIGGNTVCVENGKIFMESADCPDKLCVKMGAIDSGVLPIVCLPSRIYITVTGGGAYDAVSG